MKFDDLDDLSNDELMQQMLDLFRLPISRILASSHLMAYCQRHGMEIKGEHYSTLADNAQSVATLIDELQEYLRNRSSISNDTSST